MVGVDGGRKGWSVRGIGTGWMSGWVDGWEMAETCLEFRKLHTSTHPHTYIYISPTNPSIYPHIAFPPLSLRVYLHSYAVCLLLLHILLKNPPNLPRALLRIALLAPLVVDICDAETRAVALVPLVVAAGTVVSGRAREKGREGGD